MSRLDAIRQIGVVELTCHCWRKNYGGMGLRPIESTEAASEELYRI